MTRGALEKCTPGGYCRECKQGDRLHVGVYYHEPTCSKSPGYEVARMRAAVAKAKRQAERDALVRSEEAKRLRALRTARRVGDD